MKNTINWYLFLDYFPVSCSSAFNEQTREPQLKFYDGGGVSHVQNKISWASRISNILHVIYYVVKTLLV